MLIGYQLLSLVPQALQDAWTRTMVRTCETRGTLSFTEALPETSVGPRHDISCAVLQKSILGYR